MHNSGMSCEKRDNYSQFTIWHLQGREMKKPASEGRRRAWHVQVLSYFLFAYKYNITHRLSQHLAALSRNSMEQGERDDGDRGPGGNLADDDVKGS